MRPRSLWVFGFLALVLAGCARLRDEKTISLDSKKVQPAFEIPAQSSDMKLTITVSSPGVPVSVYLVLKGDADDVMNGLERGQASPKIIAKQEKGESLTLEGTAPANKDCTVVLMGGDKQANVKVAVVGK